MLKGNRILAIVPARGGSKGIPRKNLRCINGQSLLALTIKTAKLSRYVDHLIVSSEDEEIIAEGRRAGAAIPFIRPLELAQDDTPGSMPILHALTHLTDYDYVIVLQVTSPLRTVEDIDNALEFCLSRHGNACVSVTESDISPYWSFKLGKQNKLEPLLNEAIPNRRQDLPDTYYLNGSIYIAKTNWFNVHQRFLTDETIGYVMPKERSIDIDTEFDFLIAEAYLKQSILKNEQREQCN